MNVNPSNPTLIQSPTDSVYIQGIAHYLSVVSIFRIFLSEKNTPAGSAGGSSGFVVKPFC